MANTNGQEIEEKEQPTNGQFYRMPRGISPETLLENSWKTVGEKFASELGLHMTGYRRENYRQVLTFDMDHMKRLELNTSGNIMVHVNHVAMNSSSFVDTEKESHTRYYGALTGLAFVNTRGIGTLKAQIPCIVIPDRKSNTVQRNEVNSSFAELLQNKWFVKGVEKVEINPASINIYDSLALRMDGTPEFRVAVIEAAGLSGNAGGHGFHWSILEHPAPSKDEEPAASQTSRTNRTTRRPRPETPADDNQLGDSADVAAMANAS